MDLGKLVGKAKGLLDQNEEKVEAGLDKAADVIDDKTGQKHTDKIESTVEKIKGVIGDNK